MVGGRQTVMPGWRSCVVWVVFDYFARALKLGGIGPVPLVLRDGKKQSSVLALTRLTRGASKMSANKFEVIDRASTTRYPTDKVIKQLSNMEAGRE